MEVVSIGLPLMRNDTDVAPQQHMFKRVSSSGVLLLMDEGGGGMQSMVCVLKMESDGTSRGCGTKDIRGKQHVTRHTSHVTCDTTRLGCRFLHTIGPSSSPACPTHAT